MKLRLQNDALARILHNPLYERVIDFCTKYTPEVPASIFAGNILSRLYAGDDRLHILVDLDNDYKIKGHAILEVQQQGDCKVIFCYQAYADKGTNSTLDQGMKYIDELAAAIHAESAMFTVTQHSKVLEKKYGYKAVRTVMVKNYEYE